MLDNYEKFKKDVYVLTKIDLNCYKEKQIRLLIRMGSLPMMHMWT